MHLLDTNHCSRLLQGHPVIIQKLKELGDAPLATCVILRGELIFMAHKSERNRENLHHVHQFLSDISIYPIDNETADIYGKLKALLLDHFGPKEKALRRKIELSRLGFSDNDLWIAAIAKRYDLIVVSADQDFQRLKDIAELTVETWWTPECDR